MSAYSDIITLTRPVSARHPQMRRADRAKQFMPFASLRGYGDAIADRETIYAPRSVLSEEDGARQHGLPEMHIADLGADTDTLQRAQQEAAALLADDPGLQKEENALLRGVSYQEGATARVRNTQVGGHAAGEEAAL